MELNNKEITGHPVIVSSLWFSTPPIERADNEATKTLFSQFYTQRPLIRLTHKYIATEIFMIEKI